MFNKTAVTTYAKRELISVCVNGEYCTLKNIERIYGKGKPQAWLVIQLTGLAEALGLQGKATPYQLADIAELLYDEWGWLKYTEFLQAFKFLRTCDFFGRFDTSTIIKGMRSFNSQVRIPTIEAYEKEEQAKREEQWKRDAVPPPPHIAEKLKGVFTAFDKRTKAVKPVYKDEKKNAEMRKYLIEKYGKENTNAEQPQMP